MNRFRASTVVLTALVVLWVGPPLSGQTPAGDLIEAINKLKHGANAILVNSERRSALMLAEAEGHRAVVKLLVGK